MRRVLVLFCCVVLTSLAAFAGDPPGRVARLNYINGQVSLQPGGVNDWVAASINRPLTTTDKVWTDRDSRAELQMGAASARLNSETSLTLANVSDNAVQLQLDQGTLNLHVVKLFDGEIYEIDTPNLAFTVEKAGDYRFDVDNAGDTTVVTAWSGRGEATGDNPGIRISKGQQFTFRGGRSLQYVMTNAPGFDGFDSWCMARAEREDKSLSLRYVSPYAVGYSDLDEYGRWETIAPYGPVWIPVTVASGWAPYRWGHWVFIAPWGWTWVDDAPWGFAPFHYGRWVYFGSRWGWCPGPYYARPIYAPALVGWIGGSHWGVGLSFGVGGGVGWFPLGWGEPYIPYYRHSRGYFQNVNVTNTHITNITYITNNYYGGQNVDRIHYVNMHTPQAITAVSNATFVQSRPTRTGVVPITRQSLTGAAVVSTLPVRPTRESTMGPGRPTAAPPVMATRPVVTRTNPPVATPNRATAPEFGRPGRPSTPITGPGSAPMPTDSMNRPSRAIPYPPKAATPATMAEEAPRDIPQPNGTVVTTPAPTTMPSRVPRPNPGYTSTPSTSPGYVPSRVPHPPAAINTAPTNTAPVISDRPTRGASTQVPHPPTTPTPTPAPNVYNQQRPSRTQTYSAPAPTTSAPPAHTSPPPAPVHTSQPAPAPQQSHPSEPSRQSRPERKSDTDNKPHSELSYPRPYGDTVRPASFASSSVPRPSGPLAAAPRVYQTSYRPAHAHSVPTRPSFSAASHSAYSAPRNSSYSHSGGGNAPRMSAGVTQSSRGSAQGGSHSSGSRASGGHGR
ncbi:MAG: DUF6600 domain-containing protein [Terriglobales bacterium]